MIRYVFNPTRPLVRSSEAKRERTPLNIKKKKGLFSPEILILNFFCQIIARQPIKDRDRLVWLAEIEKVQVKAKSRRPRQYSFSAQPLFSPGKNVDSADMSLFIGKNILRQRFNKVKCKA